ncbi:MAG: glycosyltransferase family 39 protein [Acidobacteriota bacterium]|nr:glycosyltransferase family 39 protein [Acidobacteriota bacterium]
MRWSVADISPATRRRALLCAGVILLAFTVRFLTAGFISAHITDSSWFPYGIYGAFDGRARDILDGKVGAFWVGDALTSPQEATAAVYPPGYYLWLAFIYSVSGERSPLVVQSVQLTLDALSVLLIIAVGATAYGWRAGIIAGLLAALSPLLAFYGAMPLADAPTEWIVLCGALMLLLAARRLSWRYALLAGTLFGASCWLRANGLMLGVGCALALLFFVKASWQNALRLSAVFMLGVLLLLAPVIARNSFAFHAFVPGGMGLGTNMLEGIGETSRAEEFGAVFGDSNLIEQERAEMGLPKDAPLELYYPDGLRRDRARMNKALAVIVRHPFWFAGVMFGRMAGMLKYAGEPLKHLSTSGINVTSKRCLPANLQGSVLALLVNLLGALQSVLRYLLLPLMIVGAALALRRDWRATLLLLTVILYYLVVGSALHTELRYGLPMQALLFVFAGLTTEKIVRSLKSGVWSQKTKDTSSASDSRP